VIASSDPSLLRNATKTAEEFARQFMRDDIAGIAFLGAIVRGYFDDAADINIALFTRNARGGPAIPQIQHVDGFEMHCHVADIDAEESAPWDTAKRWAFSESRIYHDPDGRISRLLRQKVPLGPDERRWLLISGITLSEWYINRLTALWVQRGSIASAHSMFNPGLNHFFDVLFSLNNRLVADHKWRYYCAERLPILPPDFGARMGSVMTLHSPDEDELKRRRDAFMEMWRGMLALVEKDVGMRWEEFKDTV
jgi:hypothetical protein